VVRDADARDRAVASVADAAAELGLEVAGSSTSPITGAKKGNVEFFLHLVAGDPSATGGAAPGV
jgi:predicted rRNA methylase YqxC with S4 and FtsJ domains